MNTRVICSGFCCCVSSAWAPATGVAACCRSSGVTGRQAAGLSPRTEPLATTVWTYKIMSCSCDVL